MDRYDVLMVLGIALISIGCGLVYLPLGLIGCGVGCLAIAIVGARGEAAARGAAAPKADNVATSGKVKI